MQKNKIFISYRQSDTQSEASRLKENLEDVFGAENVFFDIETLEPGLNFAKAIEKTIRQSAVVLVLIGETWTEVKDEDGNLRLFKEDDWVRKEVAMALDMEDTRVIPVLVKDAKKLSAAQLPENIKSLAEYQWAELTIPRWRSDVEKLITSLEKIIPPLKKEPEKRKVMPPPPQPKSWWAKNYLWVLGVFVIIMIIASWPNEQQIDDYQPEEENIVLDDGGLTPAELQKLRDDNPGGTEIIERLQPEVPQEEVTAQIPNYAGKWWLWQDGLRNGHLLIDQNGGYFNFQYFYFDQKMGEGKGEFDGTYLYSTIFQMYNDPNIYGFSFGSADGGASWFGQTFTNNQPANAELRKD